MTTNRLSLVNSLRSRPGDYTKDARMTNAYPDRSNGVELLRKRPAAKSLGGAVIGANTQLLGNLLEAHVGIVGAGGGLVTINESSSSSAETFTTSTKTTGANCTSVAPSVSFLSVRGVGNGTWYYRSVRWRVEHFNGSSWVAGSYKTVAMGAQSSTAQNDTTTYTFPSAGVWQWRIYAEAFDTNGTTWGAVTYSYSSENVSAANISANQQFPTTAGGKAVYATFGAPTGSDEIYQITYNATPSIRYWVSAGNDTYGLLLSLAHGYTSGTHYTVNPSSYNHQNSLTQTIATGKIGTTIGSVTTTPVTWSPGAQSHTVSGSSLSFNNKFWALGCNARVVDVGTMTIEFTMTAMSATIYRRRITSTNSTTAANTYTAASYSEAYAVDGSASNITDATRALIVVVDDDVSIFDLSTLP